MSMRPSVSWRSPSALFTSTATTSTRAGMKREDVHAPAIAVVVEAHLDLDQPAERGELLGDSLLYRCVRSIGDAVELLAVPSQRDVDGRAEGTCDLLDRPKRQPTNVATLQSRDELTRDADALAEIRLTPAALASEVTDSARQVRSHPPNDGVEPITGPLPCGRCQT